MTSPCPFCGSPTYDATISEEVEADGYLVIVKNIDGERCESCNRTTVSRSEGERIKKAIDEAIRKRKEGPKIESFTISLGR